MTIKIDRPETSISREPLKIDRFGSRLSKFPRVETIFDDEGDPLEAVDYEVEDLEASADEEMSEIVRQIKEQKKARYEQFRIASDPDFYLLMCFQSSDQKKEFLEKSKWEAFQELFVNGLEVASMLNLEIAFQPIKPLPLRGRPNKYSKKEVI